jgi:tRNA dimethylallyltransferase
MFMNKLLIITGPTATGKSVLAVEIAKLYNGEIISADSRQVYIGLDIGSAKITAEEMGSIPHHCIDIVNPVTQVFTVADFQKLAREKINDIQSHGKLPILCGGTGMYIDATVFDMQFPTVEPDHVLRVQLEQKTTDELFNMLSRLDPVRAGNIDNKNKIRLIRALEIYQSTGQVPTIHKTTLLYDTLWIGLQLPKETMLQQIRTRITDRIPALFNEIRHVQSIGVSDERLHGFGLEYRYGLMYIQHEITETQFIDLLTTKTWQFSKRQMTWFKRNNEINWFNPITDKQKILERVKDFLS